MSRAQEIAAVKDDDIQYVAANSHAYYIQIGAKSAGTTRTASPVTVTWMPGYGLHWCATCNLNECEDTRRVAKWQETNPPPAWLNEEPI